MPIRQPVFYDHTLTIIYQSLYVVFTFFFLSHNQIFHKSYCTDKTFSFLLPLSLILIVLHDKHKTTKKVFSKPQKHHDLLNVSKLLIQTLFRGPESASSSFSHISSFKFNTIKIHIPTDFHLLLQIQYLLTVEELTGQIGLIFYIKLTEKI